VWRIYPIIDSDGIWLALPETMTVPAIIAKHARSPPQQR
jgi:hypothetical protein